VKNLIKFFISGILLKGRVFWKGARHAGAVSFTFDDGPHPEHTRGVLNALDEVKGKATFFVLGENVSKYKNVVKEIIERGHEIGIHTYSHLSMKKVSYSEYKSDINRCEKELSKVGVETILFRPPFGDVEWKNIFDLSKRRKIIFWNKDTLDYSFSDIASAWEYSRTLSIKSGDILLMHDINPHTPDLVRRLGKEAANAGIDIKTISKLLG